MSKLGFQEKCLARGRRRILTAALAAGAFAGLLAAPALAQDTVKIGTASTSVVHAPLTTLVVDPAIAAKHNIKLEVTDLRGNSANCVAALLSGAIDLCQVGTTTGTDAIAEGANLKAVAVITGPINELILSAKTVAKLGVSPTASVEDKLRALKGLRIVSSAPGTAHYTTLTAMLKIVGLKPEDLQFRTLTDVTAMMESIRNDQIDGAMWSIGSLGHIITDKSGVRWISMAKGDVKDLATLPYVTVYGRGDWIDKNPDLARRVNASYADAIDRLKNNPGNASALIKAKYFPDLDQGLWDDGFEQARGSFLKDAKGFREGWQRFLELQAADTGKNYAPSAFDKAVMPFARAN